MKMSDWRGLVWACVASLSLGCGSENEVAWLMVQDAADVSFAFDDAVDSACPSEALWSGTMTLTGADDATLWFSNRPYRLAFSEPTSEFITKFGATFTAETGGNPNAVVTWEDADTAEDRYAFVELRYVSPSSPGFDESTATLTYQVCGAPRYAPNTEDPLPADEQFIPSSTPAVSGRVSLFIDLYFVTLNELAGRSL